MPYKALLFDLDNTLIDFSVAEKQGLHKIHHTYFKNSISIHEFEQCFYTINKRLWHLVEQKQITINHLHRERFQLLAQKLKVTSDPIKIAHHYAQTLGDYSDWYPGTKEVLLALKKDYSIGIATNGVAQVKKIQYMKLEMAKLCDCFLVSEVLGISKPDKAIFTLALQQLNATATEVLMVGDSLSSDYQGAINAGLDFCWVNKEAQLLPTTFPIPKYTVQSVVELSPILSSHASVTPDSYHRAYSQPAIPTCLAMNRGI